MSASSVLTPAGLRTGRDACRGVRSDARAAPEGTRIQSSQDDPAHGDAAPAAPAAPTDRAAGAAFSFSEPVLVLLTAMAWHDRHDDLDSYLLDLIGKRAEAIGLDSLFRAALEAER